MLNYHRAMPGNLREHLLFLRRYCRVLPLEQALEELYAPDQKQGPHGRRDRRIPVVLTFDDGYRDNYTHGFVLAQELHMPFTVFLPTGYIDSGENYWWQEGERIVRHAQVDKVVVNEIIYCLNELEDRKALKKEIFDHLRDAPSLAEREAFLKDMRVALGVPMSLTLEEELMLPMTWEQILEMDRSGFVTFGAHTVHHPVLACLKDPAEVQREVRECREVLEKKLDHSARAFAYTMGKPGDIDMQTLQAVKEAGYDWAFTTVSGVNTPRSNPYQLLRIHVDADHDWLFVAALVSGIWLFISPLWHKAAFSLRRSQE
ncbi:MAG: hypothetical protein NVS3B14_13860 [Ktedonobacteraceae bacterium]